jgi:hypothetical protein
MRGLLAWLWFSRVVVVVVVVVIATELVRTA